MIDEDEPQWKVTAEVVVTFEAFVTAPTPADAAHIVGDDIRADKLTPNNRIINAISARRIRRHEPGDTPEPDERDGNEKPDD